jgi:anaerobic selenocysteine-containing dehydrogenase
LRKFSFSLYQGFFLPDLMKGNFLFLPSSNFLEHEDSFINIFGDLQFTNQVLDSHEEEVKSDFFIFKKLIFFFFSNQMKSNFQDLISFDFLFNEIIFYYFNFFCFIFDSFPLLNNYYVQNLSVFSFQKIFFFTSFYKFNSLNYFFIRYSKTLNNFHLNKLKQENNFS